MISGGLVIYERITILSNLVIFASVDKRVISYEIIGIAKLSAMLVEG